MSLAHKTTDNLVLIYFSLHLTSTCYHFYKLGTQLHKFLKHISPLKLLTFLVLVFSSSLPSDTPSIPSTPVQVSFSLKHSLVLQVIIYSLRCAFCSYLSDILSHATELQVIHLWLCLTTRSGVINLIIQTHWSWHQWQRRGGITLICWKSHPFYLSYAYVIYSTAALT